MSNEKMKKDNVSVEKAMKRGEQFLIAVPMYLALLCIIGVIYIWNMDSVDTPTAIVGSILLLLVPLLYRSVAVTHWRIWAFARVRNVNELKKEALKEVILFKEGGWIERIEFRTPYQREILQELEGRLKRADDIDYSDIYPTSLGIRFSRTKFGIGLIFTAFFCILGLWLLYEQNLWGCASVCIGLIFGWEEIRKHRKGDQLRFDNKGIFSAIYGFVPWNRIKDAHVMTLGGTSETSSLEYKRVDQDVAIEELKSDVSMDDVNKMLEEWNEANPEGLEEMSGEEDPDETEDTDFESEEDEGYNESINIDELNIDASELRKIIKVYRNRYLQSLTKDR